MAILVNGGAGYIGSHTCIELMKAGYEIIVADNLYNSCEEALRRVVSSHYAHLVPVNAKALEAGYNFAE